MAGTTIDLASVFPIPSGLGEARLRELGELMRLGLVHFVEAEIEQLKKLSGEPEAPEQARELLLMRSQLVALRLRPHFHAGQGKVQVKSSGETPDSDWMEDRLLIGFTAALGKLKNAQPVDGKPGPKLENQYVVPQPVPGSSGWWKWLLLLPTGISIAILIVLFSWISDLKSQYEILTNSILLQKEQILTAVEEGLEKGVEAGKLYDQLKDWVLEPDEGKVTEEEKIKSVGPKQEIE